MRAMQKEALLAMANPSNAATVL